MSLTDLPGQAKDLAQAEYEALRTKANSFMNRNWWAVCLGCLVGGYLLGLLRGWPIF